MGTARNQKLCPREVSDSAPRSTQSPHDIHFSQQVLALLRRQRTLASTHEQKRFVDHLLRSIRVRRAVAKRWAKTRTSDDIIGLIQLARDAGDADESIWRCFLAAHFGRASANDDQALSATKFLCGFGHKPHWTWSRTTTSRSNLRKWLRDHKADLQSLAFGNHRKYESKRPDNIYHVVNSFVDLSQEYGGPAGLLALDSALLSDGGFDVLYKRLKPLKQFGRTGRFDFLALLLDLGLISSQPVSCYLRGSTGPKDGAAKLWGNQSIGQLDYLAKELSHRLGISPMAVEDALCNWQK